MFQVSVLVVTYNPDLQKLLLTLQAAVTQKNVDFEIILSDDGSPEDNHFSEAENFFKKVGFTNYQLLENPVNMGTVKNCISAITVANGEYIFTTSPGDVLFDETALADFYRYVKENNIKLCFGNAVHYVFCDDKAKLTQEYSFLKKPSIYSKNKPLPMIRSMFMQGNFVVGAAIMQERIATERWFRAAAETAVYMEDSTSTAYALAEKVPLTYYNRNFVWYEDGTGVSTSGSNIWSQRLKADWKNTLDRLCQLYPRDPYIDLARITYNMPDTKMRKLYKMLKHPIAFLSGKLNDMISKPQPVYCSPEDIQRLESIYCEVTKWK